MSVYDVTIVVWWRHNYDMVNIGKIWPHKHFHCTNINKKSGKYRNMTSQWYADDVSIVTSSVELGYDVRDTFIARVPILLKEYLFKVKIFSIMTSQ